MMFASCQKQREILTNEKMTLVPSYKKLLTDRSSLNLEIVGASSSWPQFVCEDFLLP